MEGLSKSKNVTHDPSKQPQIGGFGTESRLKGKFSEFFCEG